MLLGNLSDVVSLLLVIVGLLPCQVCQSFPKDTAIVSSRPCVHHTNNRALFLTFTDDETTFLIEDSGPVPIHTCAKRSRTVSRIDSLESGRRGEREEVEEGDGIVSSAVAQVGD